MPTSGGWVQIQGAGRAARLWNTVQFSDNQKCNCHCVATTDPDDAEVGVTIGKSAAAVKGALLSPRLGRVGAGSPGSRSMQRITCDSWVRAR